MRGTALPDSNRRGRAEEFDARLLAQLRQDARMPVSELATRLGVSRAHVYAGIARLEQDGTIGGYTVRLGAAHDRRTVHAHVLMTVLPKLQNETIEALVVIPETIAIHAVAGHFDLIAVVEAPSVERLNDVIDAIGMIEGVERTISSVVLATKLRR